jgi:hypothetical protein
MRDTTVRAFYYPEMFAADATLKKAILFFDELHFIDRPAITFGGRGTTFGSIGADSPFRRVEGSFREHGMPLYVHPAPGGWVSDEWYADIAADINDLEFLRRFQRGPRLRYVSRSSRSSRQLWRGR